MNTIQPLPKATNQPASQPTTKLIICRPNDITLRKSIQRLFVWRRSSQQWEHESSRRNHCFAAVEKGAPNEQHEWIIYSSTFGRDRIGEMMSIQLRFAAGSSILRQRLLGFARHRKMPETDSNLSLNSRLFFRNTTPVKNQDSSGLAS